MQENYKILVVDDDMRLRALLEACESSLGYAKKSHQKAALLCVQYGLDGGYGAAEIRAMIPRMGYAWEAQ